MWPLSIVSLVMIILTMMISEHEYQQGLKIDKQQVDQQVFLFTGYSRLLTLIDSKSDVHYQQIAEAIKQDKERESAWLSFNPINWCDSNLQNQQVCHWGAIFATDEHGKQSAYFYYRSPSQRQRLRNDMLGVLSKKIENANLVGIKKGETLTDLQGKVIVELPSTIARETADGVLMKIIKKG